MALRGKQVLRMPVPCWAHCRHTSFCGDNGQTTWTQHSAACMRCVMWCRYAMCAVQRCTTNGTQQPQALPTLSLPDVIGAYVHRAGQAAVEGMVPPLHKAAASMACARQLVDGALRHPAVMTRLSVPPEHHVAVYMPLLLPLLVPLARGIIAEGSRAVRRVWRQ